MLLSFSNAAISQTVTLKKTNDTSKPVEANSTTKIVLSGYLQTEFQQGEKDAALKIGAANTNTNTNNDYNRVGIRRGRVKFAFEKGISTGALQLDMTEKGISLKDAYIKINDPWNKKLSTTLGVFNRPFGQEIAYSSSNRESPERSNIYQILFPEERDLGVMLTAQTPSSNRGYILKLNAGLFAGNGIKREIDNRKDFIGQICMHQNNLINIKWTLGISYYNGSVYHGTTNVYQMVDKKFVLDTNQRNIVKYAKREYWGLDAQININSKIGASKIVAEYLTGTQPGVKQNSKSPNSSDLVLNDKYIRKFRGGYLMYVQNITKSPFATVIKYEWYDPNTKVSSNEIGINKTNAADIASKTIGLGILWNINKSLRLTAYYDIVNNENSPNLKGYEKNRLDNVFTFRLQCKF